MTTENAAQHLIELLRWRMRYMDTFEGIEAYKVSSGGSCMAGRCATALMMVKIASAMAGYLECDRSMANSFRKPSKSPKKEWRDLKRRQIWTKRSPKGRIRADTKDVPKMVCNIPAGRRIKNEMRRVQRT